MVTSSASIAPVLRTRSQVPPITLADYSSQATAQIPSFRNPQIHQTAQREQKWLHSKSTSPGPLIYVNPISPPPPAWAALSTRGAQRALRHRQERREPAGAWKSRPHPHPWHSISQPPTAAPAQIPKEPFFGLGFSPQVEKHPRGEMWAIWQGPWEHALPSTFGKTNSKTPGETSFSHQVNPLDPLPPTHGPSSQPLNLSGDEGSRRRGHIHSG